MIKPLTNKVFQEVLNPDDENFKLIDKNSLKVHFFISNDEYLNLKIIYKINGKIKQKIFLYILFNILLIV